jgi:hypothetical protein
LLCTRFGKIEVNRHDILATLTLEHSNGMADVRVALMTHLYLYVVVQVHPALLPPAWAAAAYPAEE